MYNIVTYKNLYLSALEYESDTKIHSARLTTNRFLAMEWSLEPTRQVQMLADLIGYAKAVYVPKVPE